MSIAEKYDFYPPYLTLNSIKKVVFNTSESGGNVTRKQICVFFKTNYFMLKSTHTTLIMNMSRLILP